MCGVSLKGTKTLSIRQREESETFVNREQVSDAQLAAQLGTTHTDTPSEKNKLNYKDNEKTVLFRIMEKLFLTNFFVCENFYKKSD